jgi:hypothetical protein
MKKILALLVVLALFPLPAPAVTLEEEVEAFLLIPSVVGREEPAAEFLTGRLAGLPVTRDALGNIAVTIGSGSPRRLVACPMGEPGYVVSRIHENGYLRLIPAAGVPRPALWDQSHFGQTVEIGGARGWVAGAVVLPYVHLMEGRSRPPEKPVFVNDLWVDVGAESAGEVAETGVRLLDAVALVRRPSRIAGGLIAAPSIRIMNKKDAYNRGELVQVALADFDEACVHVEMYDGAKRVETKSRGPLYFRLSALTPGKHKLSFVATDGTRSTVASLEALVQ